jgi:signal transduction histidine kinase
MHTPLERITTSIAKAHAELEEALLELEKLPAVSQGAVGFAAHALNNFLTVTGGTVELLQLSLADHPGQDVHKGLAALERATVLMSHTVTQLLTSSTEVGVKLRMEPVHLPLMAQRFCFYYQRSAERKKIHCIAETSGETPPAWSDRVMVAAVLDNLISNAVKYSPHGKEVRIQVTASADTVVCSVHDQGPGLSADDQKKLFKRGGKLTPQPTGGEPSTGFGLAVAKEFLDKLGGTISCQSTLGQGACFSFSLPRYQEALHGKHPAANNHKPAEPRQTPKLW